MAPCEGESCAGSFSRRDRWLPVGVARRVCVRLRGGNEATFARASSSAQTDSGFCFVLHFDARWFVRKTRGGSFLVSRGGSNRGGGNRDEYFLCDGVVIVMMP